MGVGAIDVHDFDRVEIHNLTRSVFLRESDVGASKARRGRGARCRDRPERAPARGRGRRLAHPAAGRTCRGATCVICAVDNLEARMRLSQLCLLAGVDLVNAGIDSRYASVEVFALLVARALACFECHLPGQRLPQGGRALFVRLAAAGACSPRTGSRRRRSPPASPARWPCRRRCAWAARGRSVAACPARHAQRQEHGRRRWRATPMPGLRARCGRDRGASRRAETGSARSRPMRRAPTPCCCRTR